MSSGITELFRAAAYSPNFLFGRESFEAGTLPGSFTSYVHTSSDTLTVDPVDTTNVNAYKVRNRYSVRVTPVGNASAVVEKNLGSSYTELWMQMKVFIPEPFTYPAAGYFGAMKMWGADYVSPLVSGTQVFFMNIENDGADYSTNRFRITFGGASGYINSNVNVPANRMSLLEFHIKVSATVGNIKCWVNNTVSGSPDYDSGNINMGTTGIQWLHVGNPFTDVGGCSSWWFDDVVADSAFIGTR